MATIFGVGDTAIEIIIKIEAIVPLKFIPIVTAFVYLIGSLAAAP